MTRDGEKGKNNAASLSPPAGGLIFRPGVRVCKITVRGSFGVHSCRQPRYTIIPASTTLAIRPARVDSRAPVRVYRVFVTFAVIK